MKVLADLHISPRTVAFLRTLGHEAVRVDAILPKTASDEEIVAAARDSGRVVLTQDLDFSAIVAISGARTPSLITLRLASSRVEHVNEILARVRRASSASAAPTATTSASTWAKPHARPSSTCTST